MTGNFFADNADLQYRLDDLNLEEAIGILENGYSYHEQFPAAPRNYADAMDSYRRILTVLGDICANQIAPRAAEADEEGAQFDGWACRLFQRRLGWLGTAAPSGDDGRTPALGAWRPEPTGQHTPDDDRDHLPC